MPSEQNQFNDKASEKKKKKVAKKKLVLKNVVSLRVSDQEKRLLERLTESTSQNVSDLVREAIGFWLSKRPGIFRGAKSAGQTLQMDSNDKGYCHQ